ncbi:MAG: hypothetical protein ACRDHO_09685 [Actinomycetota bacterium]
MDSLAPMDGSGRRRFTRFLKPLAGLAAAAVVAAAATSCGSEKGAESLSAETLADVADRTVGKGSARISVELQMEGLPGLDQPLVITGESLAELSGRRQRSEMDFPLLLLGDEGAGDRTQPVLLVVDRPIVHMNMPFLSEALQSPTAWIRMDLENLPPGAEDLQSLATGQNDPSQAINYLRGATGDLRRLGEAEVRGVATTQYRGTVDLDLAAQRAPEDVRESVEASRSEVESQIGTTKLPANVWIDQDGVVRRVRYEYPLPANPEAQIVFTADLSDFGIKVDVAPPPPDQVTNLEDLAPAE